MGQRAAGGGEDAEDGGAGAAAFGGVGGFEGEGVEVGQVPAPEGGVELGLADFDPGADLIGAGPEGEFKEGPWGVVDGFLVERGEEFAQLRGGLGVQTVEEGAVEGREGGGAGMGSGRWGMGRRGNG